MPRSRDSNRPPQPPRERGAPPTHPPAQSAVEQAIRAILERLKPAPRPEKVGRKAALKPKPRRVARPSDPVCD